MAGATRLLTAINFTATTGTLTETTTLSGPVSGGLHNALFMIDVTGVTGTHDVNVRYVPGSNAYSVAKSVASLSATGLVTIALNGDLTATTAGNRTAIPHPTDVLVTSNTAGDVLQANIYLVTGG